MKIACCVLLLALYVAGVQLAVLPKAGECLGIVVDCFIDPCESAKISGGCDAYPDATCQSNFCSGCHTIWHYNGHVVQC